MNFAHKKFAQIFLTRKVMTFEEFKLSIFCPFFETF